MNPPYRCFINAHDVDKALITTIEQTSPLITASLAETGYKPKNRNERTHQFYDPQHPQEPQGVTAAYLLEDSRDGFVRRSPGHLTIHTWPENNSFAMDIVLGRPDSTLVERIHHSLPGDYVMVIEHRGDVRGDLKLARSIGREVAAYFPQIENTAAVYDKRIQDLLEDIGKQAGFKVVNKLGRESLVYASGIVILSTSHLSLHYDARSGECWIDAFTCIEDGKDEGDPKIAIDLLEGLLKPKPHPERYILKEPFRR